MVHPQKIPKLIMYILILMPMRELKKKTQTKHWAYVKEKF
jgi:hypothetical protein